VARYLGRGAGRRELTAMARGRALEDWYRGLCNKKREKGREGNQEDEDHASLACGVCVGRFDRP
jgi:hypothetical protein